MQRVELREGEGVIPIRYAQGSLAVHTTGRRDSGLFGGRTSLGVRCWRGLVTRTHGHSEATSSCSAKSSPASSSSAAAQANGLVGQPQDAHRHDEGIDEGGEGEHCLSLKLQHAARRSVGVDGETGEDAGEDDADEPSHHVHPDDVECVVVAKT